MHYVLHVLLLLLFQVATDVVTEMRQSMQQSWWALSSKLPCSIGPLLRFGKARRRHLTETLGVTLKHACWQIFYTFWSFPSKNQTEQRASQADPVWLGSLLQSKLAVCHITLHRQAGIWRHSGTPAYCTYCWKASVMVHAVVLMSDVTRCVKWTPS